jgi:hypothetical protein
VLRNVLDCRDDMVRVGARRSTFTQLRDLADRIPRQHKRPRAIAPLTRVIESPHAGCSPLPLAISCFRSKAWSPGNRCAVRHELDQAVQLTAEPRTSTRILQPPRRQRCFNCFESKLLRRAVTTLVALIAFGSGIDQLEKEFLTQLNVKVSHLRPRKKIGDSHRSLAAHARAAGTFGMGSP